MKLFHVYVSFLNSLKISENAWFSDILSDIEKMGLQEMGQ